MTVVKTPITKMIRVRKMCLTDRDAVTALSQKIIRTVNVLREKQSVLTDIVMTRLSKIFRA
jgi:hypothetical protein